jgi:hypothetical protein
MKQINKNIGVLIFATLILTSCGGGGNSSSTESKNNKIIALDTCINNSKEITDFLLVNSVEKLKIQFFKAFEFLKKTTKKVNRKQ